MGCPPLLQFKSKSLQNLVDSALTGSGSASHRPHQSSRQIKVEEPVKHPDQNQRHVKNQADDADDDVGAEGEHKTLQPCPEDENGQEHVENQGKKPESEYGIHDIPSL